MNISSLFECFSIVVARQLGQKRKRRAAQLRRRLGAQQLEQRAMMDGDPLADYGNSVATAQAAFQSAATTADANYQSAFNSAVSDLEDASAPVSAALDSDTISLTQNLNNETNTASQQYGSDTQTADQTANSSEQAADATMNQNIAQAQTDLTNQDAAYEQTSNAVINQIETSLASAETQHESNFESIAGAAQMNHDLNVAADEGSMTSANSADAQQLQETVSAILATKNSADSAAAATRDAAIGSMTYSVDPATIASVTDYVSPYYTATGAFENTQSTIQASLDAGYATAHQNEADKEQVANDALNVALQADQATDDAAVQAAENNYNQALVPIQQTLDNSLSADQATYDGEVQSAADQFTSDSQGANAALAAADQAADTAYNSSAQPLIDAYQQFVTTRMAFYNSQAQARLDQLNQDLQQEETDYSDKVAGYGATDVTSDAAVIASYNATVQALQQTQSTSDQPAFDAFDSSVSAADHALTDAESAYDDTVNQIYTDAMQNNTTPDQSALDAAWNTLLVAKHSHANAVAQAQEALVSATGADAVQFWTSEGLAYLAEQDGLASNDGAYITQVAAAYKELQDQEANSQASYETDIGNDQASMNNDVDSQYGTEQTSVRGFEDTRQKAYAVAEQNSETQMTTAYNNEWRADIAAEREQGENDSAAYAAYGVAILGPWQTEMNAIMTATVAQVAADSAAKTVNADAIAAAKGQELLDEEAAGIAADSATAAALQTYFSQVASAWLTAVSEVTEDDPDSISVAQACLAYSQSLLTDATAAQSQMDAAEQPILQDEVANWEGFIGEASSEDEALANAVAAATTTQVSQDAASIVSAGSQEVAETQGLADEEIAAAATEAGKEVAAYIADSAAWAAAEGGRAVGYISAATTWILSVIPTAVSDQESLNSDAASANGQIASNIADFATKLDAAQQQEADDLVGPAKTEIHDVAVARNTLVVAQVTQQASDAETAAQSSAATIAAEPDADFSDEEQGGAGEAFMGQPSQPETPTMGETLAPYTAPQPTKAEQIALDNSWSCQKGLNDAQTILGASSPELRAIIGAAWNAANNLSITTTFFSYPVGSGRPHCADYAGTIQAAIKGVQQNKFSVENKAFTQLGNHEIMVKDDASGKEIAIYVDPAGWAGYNSGLDGVVFGPTFYVVDGQLERALEVELQEASDQAAEAEKAGWEWIEKNGLPPPITD